jgi:hypothetical protein
MIIDWKRLGRWFKREALPVLEDAGKVAAVNIIIKSDLTDEVRDISDKYNIPEALAQEIVSRMKSKLVQIIKDA